MLGTSFSVNEKVCKLAGRKTFQEHYVFFLATSASLYNSFHAFVSLLRWCETGNSNAA